MLSRFRSFIQFRRAVDQMLAHPLTLDECLQDMKNRLENRNAAFLELLNFSMKLPENPYRWLLEHAGITYDDVVRELADQGLEGTLETLRDAGVYLTFEEYKGRQLIVRDGREFSFDSRSLWNPEATGLLNTRTGGSTGLPVEIPQNPMQQRISASQIGPLYHYCLPPGTKIALWRSESPFGSVRTLLRYCQIDRPPDAWFTVHGHDHSFWTGWQKRLLTSTTIRLARKHGYRVPMHEHIPIAEVDRIVDWISYAKQTASACLVNCNVSNAVRVCEAARRRGVDIGGTRFFMISEPLTAAKRREIQSAGAIPFSVYSSIDAGRITVPCTNPSTADDSHVCQDTVAVITRRRRHPGTDEEIDSLLITTFPSIYPVFLLNVEMDDYGVLERRQCGCHWEELGLPWHLSGIRSFAKLTLQGTTVSPHHVSRIIEHELPKRFGGSSIHYQLVEENAALESRLILLISPAVGRLDESDVVHAFLEALKKSHAKLEGPAELWETFGSIHVMRREPLLTSRGKLMPVRILQEHERIN